MKRRLLILCMAAAMTALLFGCGKKAEEVPDEPVEEEPDEPVQEPDDTEDADAIPEGSVKSYLTGEWIDGELAGKRPYAVMIGNTQDSLPQYGIGSADVIYEAPVEASITRLMAIFQDVSGLDKIGSVRSCRHYYIYFAKEFDAIYAHYGQSIYAKPILEQKNVHNISGLDGSIEGIAFYRDKSRRSPHNAFTGGEELLAATEKKGYRTDYAESYQGHYQFAKDHEPVELTEGEDALVVSPGYFINKPWFNYNEDDGLYYRYEFNQKQIDGATNEQLKVKNIIVQYCNWNMADENGYLDIKTIPSDGQGTGKYITNGKMIDVTWTKENEDSPARYFDASGNEITLNQGKTWVCIVRNKYKERFQVFRTEAELKEAGAAE